MPAPHLLPGKSFEEDPSGLQGTYRGVAGNQNPAAYPLVWRTFAGTLYDHPLEMLYREMIPHRSYLVRVHFVVDGRRISLFANGTNVPPTCDDERACLDASYTIPANLLPTSELRLVFSGEKGLGGNGRIVAVATVRVIPGHDSSQSGPHE